MVLVVLLLTDCLLSWNVLFLSEQNQYKWTKCVIVMANVVKLMELISNKLMWVKVVPSRIASENFLCIGHLMLLSSQTQQSRTRSNTPISLRIITSLTSFEKNIFFKYRVIAPPTLNAWKQIFDAYFFFVFNGNKFANWNQLLWWPLLEVYEKLCSQIRYKALQSWT